MPAKIIHTRRYVVQGYSNAGRRVQIRNGLQRLCAGDHFRDWRLAIYALLDGGHERHPRIVAERKLRAVRRLGVTYENAAAKLADFDARATIAPAAGGLAPQGI